MFRHLCRFNCVRIRRLRSYQAVGMDELIKLAKELKDDKTDIDSKLTEMTDKLQKMTGTIH